MNPNICSHYWIDPDDPPIERTSYASIIGDKRRHMKPGRSYRCINCGSLLTIPLDVQIDGKDR